MTLTESQLRLVLEKLDAVRLELLRLRAMLLPEEELSEEERRRLEEAREEIEEGKYIDLEEGLMYCLLGGGKEFIHSDVGLSISFKYPF